MKKLPIGTLPALTARRSTPAPVPGPINVSGGWTGPLDHPAEDPFFFNMQPVQASGPDSITGTAFNSVGTGTVSGKLSTSVLNVTGEDGAAAAFTGSFTATTDKGTITTDSRTGTFSFTKNQWALQEEP